MPPQIDVTPEWINLPWCTQWDENIALRSESVDDIEPQLDFFLPSSEIVFQNKNMLLMKYSTCLY